MAAFRQLRGIPSAGPAGALSFRRPLVRAAAVFVTKLITGTQKARAIPGKFQLCRFGRCSRNLPTGALWPPVMKPLHQQPSNKIVSRGMQNC